MLFNWVVLASELIKLQQERERANGAAPERVKRPVLVRALFRRRRPSPETPAAPGHAEGCPSCLRQGNLGL